MRSQAAIILLGILLAAVSSQDFESPQFKLFATSCDDYTADSSHQCVEEHISLLGRDRLVGIDHVNPPVIMKLDDKSILPNRLQTVDGLSWAYLIYVGNGLWQFQFPIHPPPAEAIVKNTDFATEFFDCGDMSSGFRLIYLHNKIPDGSWLSYPSNNQGGRKIYWYKQDENSVNGPPAGGKTIHLKVRLQQSYESL